MINKLKQLMEQLVGAHGDDYRQGEGFHTSVDQDGINFYLDADEFRQLAGGQGDVKPKIQYVVLRMLEEQGMAERFPNGYRVGSETIVSLDDEQADILALAPPYPGGFTSRIQGHTGKTTFELTLLASHSERELPFERKGPYLKLGAQQTYRLSPIMLSALTEVEHHQDLPPEKRTSQANLRLMAVLQGAVDQGMLLNLGHFTRDRLDVVSTGEIGVVATQMPDGSLHLSPSLGEGSGPDQLEQRWTQLDPESNSGALRIGKRIVLLDQKKMDGIREIMDNRHIPHEQVGDFFKTPSAFLDAALVDLDMGFSLRVLGVGTLQHIDFDAPDAQKNDWFDRKTRPLPPETLKGMIKCDEDLVEFDQRQNAARGQGADSVAYGDGIIDIASQEKVSSILDSIRRDLSAPAQDGPAPEATEETQKIQVGLILKEAEASQAMLAERVQAAAPSPEPLWEDYSRSPFPHQREGIEWMLSLIKLAYEDDPKNPDRIQGGLLADDMGLGKTYMTLVAIREYFRQQQASDRTQKPILVVAPLSLIENWEHEIHATFKAVPFRDIKVLQAGRDLREFKKKGATAESMQQAALLDEHGQIDVEAIRYALEVGPQAGVKRLDIDRRLVLTTYQTLRDYQFSLCNIDWGMVVFDEAQNLKNPNTQVTRTAKALKADFRLLATGTPVENSLGDFWCLMDTVQPGLLGDWAYFRDRWIQPISKAEESNRDQVRLEVGQDLRKCVGRFMLRRVKEDQLEDLPAKHIHSGAPDFTQDAKSFTPLGRVMKGEQLKRYDAALDDYATGQYSDDTPAHALTTLMNLRKISLHPRLADGFPALTSRPDKYREIMTESSKLEALLDTLDAIKGRGDKAIIFLTSKDLQRLLKIWLEGIYRLEVHIINGDTAAVQKRGALTRRGMIQDFEAIDGFNIILMSPVAAGVGLTVVGANHVIHLERHWNPAKEAQATDRVYRIGQLKDVHVHLPTALHPSHASFDQHLDKLLNGKLQLKDAVVTTEEVSNKEMTQTLGLLRT